MQEFPKIKFERLTQEAPDTCQAWYNDENEVTKMI